MATQKQTKLEIPEMVDLPQGFNKEDQYLIEIWKPVKDENGNFIEGLKKNVRQKVVNQLEYDANYLPTVNRRTKAQSDATMSKLGWVWNVLVKPTK